MAVLRAVRDRAEPRRRALLQAVQARAAGGALAARSRWAARKGLEALERGLEGKQFLVGERYSVADISVYAYTHVAAEGEFDLEPYPGIRAWLERVAGQPGHILITD